MDNREQIKKYSIISTNVSSINYEQSSNLITENVDLEILTKSLHWRFMD